MNSLDKEKMQRVLDAFGDYLQNNKHVRAVPMKDGSVRLIVLDSYLSPSEELPENIVSIETTLPVDDNTYDTPTELAQALWYQELTDTWVELGIGKTDVTTEGRFRMMHMGFVSAKAEQREEQLDMVANIIVELSPDAATEGC